MYWNDEYGITFLGSTKYHRSHICVVFGPCWCESARRNTFKYIPPATIFKLFRQPLFFLDHHVRARFAEELEMGSLGICESSEKGWD